MWRYWCDASLHPFKLQLTAWPRPLPCRSPPVLRKARRRQGAKAMAAVMTDEVEREGAACNAMPPPSLIVVAIPYVRGARHKASPQQPGGKTMRHSVRLVVCTVLAAGSISLAVALPGGVASAKTLKGVCTSETGNATSQTLSGCNQPADTGGSGTVVVNSEKVTGKAPKQKVKATTTITWATAKTSVETLTGSLLTGVDNKCPAGPPGYTAAAEIIEKGKVTGGTATDLVGSKAKGTSCAYTEGTTILVENLGPIDF